jgi:hypothetical protein
VIHALRVLLFERALNRRRRAAAAAAAEAEVVHAED